MVGLLLWILLLLLVSDSGIVAASSIGVEAFEKIVMVWISSSGYVSLFTGISSSAVTGFQPVRIST